MKLGIDRNDAFEVVNGEDWLLCGFWPEFRCLDISFA